MPSILDRELVYLTGKGGVGRTTVAAAVGLAGAARGRRTIVCEVAQQQRLGGLFGRDGAPDEEIRLTEGLWGVSIDPHGALRTWLGEQLGSRGLTRLLLESNAFQYFAAAAPGSREMATIVKVWELAQAQRWRQGADAYDLVVVDAPSTGHALAMLQTPSTFGEIARVGPVRRQADQVLALLRDPARTAYLAVALAEEMPVNETLELERSLPEIVGSGLETIVVNGLYPRRFEPAEIELLAAAAPPRGGDGSVRRALAAAKAEHRWRASQQDQLERLRRAAAAPVVTLPFVFAPHLGTEEVERLADELADRL